MRGLDRYKSTRTLSEEGPSFRVETSCSIKRLLEDEELCWRTLLLRRFECTTSSSVGHLSRLSKWGVRAIFGAPPWTHTEPLLREMKLCSIDIRFKLKLLIHSDTYRCTHALASSLLCQQYNLRSHSNSTHSTTRSQLTLSLCIPSAARRPGTISPLFTSTLLWNSLPAPIRSASSLHTFRQELQKYLGIPVIRPR